MRRLALGSTEIEISAVIMGTWQTGKAMWSGIEDKESLRAIKAAFDAGITTFDTAEAYGNGHSERILGQGLAGIRDKVVIASKVFSNHLAHNAVITACERSLRNLGTDYIDLYQIHWPPGSFGHPKVPLEEPLGALMALKEQGKIRAIGVSNFDRGLIEAARAHAPIESLQPPYSLFWRSMEKETLTWCREEGIATLAYSPMAQGILTGKFGPDPQFAKGDHRKDNRLFQPEIYPSVLGALDRLRPIAAELDITLAQLALAWVIAQPNTGAIAGARSADQASANAAAMAVELDAETLTEMDAISRTVTDKLDANPVQWQW
ncbi:MAG: aldo/keto reductase [Desulfosarcinaceae bacterium]|jgi:aryl-alcohol dehydrogenase-like predicted oxidoreductase